MLCKVQVWPRQALQGFVCLAEQVMGTAWNSDRDSVSGQRRLHAMASSGSCAIVHGSEILMVLG